MTWATKETNLNSNSNNKFLQIELVVKLIWPGDEDSPDNVVDQVLQSRSINMELLFLGVK